MNRSSFFSAILIGLCSGLLSIAFPARGETAAHAMTSRDGQRDTIVLGMGCFWGAEKRMSAVPGVIDVENGYANGDMEETGYRQILAHEKALRMGKTSKKNFAEVVKVTFDPSTLPLPALLAAFWENHDPTQGDRQGNDVGSNYRSAIYTHDENQAAVAIETRSVYQKALSQAGYGAITTEIAPLKNYHTAERYHQDYLEKHPNGYCGLGGTGVPYPGSPRRLTGVLPEAPVLDGKTLDFKRQLVVFEAEDCAYCKKFEADILDHWDRNIAIERTLNPHPPTGWRLKKRLVATPTIVLFEQGTEITRYTGYNGMPIRFWQWLNSSTIP